MELNLMSVLQLQMMWAVGTVSLSQILDTHCYCGADSPHLVVPVVGVALLAVDCLWVYPEKVKGLGTNHVTNKCPARG